jgi:uncharacterized membrane protein (DUF485 family)
VSPLNAPPCPDSGDASHPADDDHPDLAAANARAGLWLFALYLLLYAGFVGLSAFAPGLMGRSPFGGLNVAVLYGMVLIAAAFALALVYMGLCRWNAGRHAPGGPNR